MIKNWKIFLESKSDISYETLSEVIMFRNFSKMTGNDDPLDAAILSIRSR
jgi:hypothetical protein